MIWRRGARMGRLIPSAPRDTARYVLGNVHIPPDLCGLKPGPDGWCGADVVIDNGRIGAVLPAGQAPPELPLTDARQNILLSGLVDCHTHLDKAHVAAFETFPAGDLAQAIEAMIRNKQGWTRESLAARVEFSLKSAYAYGVRAMRSHVDCVEGGPGFVWQVMQEARDRWQGRVELQLSPLAGIGYFEAESARAGVFAMAARTGILGAFLLDQADLGERLKPLFDAAGTNGWGLDFHVDEGTDTGLNGLETLAKMALDSDFQGWILCGHCVALSQYDRARRERVIGLAVDAGLHFVALPSSNLYLQSRDPDNVPTLRGMAPVARLAARGATVSLGADNVRDGFCAFGDFDPVAVLNLGAQVGHLPEPLRDWAALITTNPASTMGLEWDGRIVPGAPADLVLFGARNSGEMGLRAPERVVIRGGEWLDLTPPELSELVE